ncbi:hypothetical protein [Nonomuraea lactucae]|uniref:hypothetical protein n=1 Tax=Nonomuraea lactucae TaxID=2249762 RepID=UPI000DE40222|nr:hypothetical protein [Nonomuraea lactucae]
MDVESSICLSDLVPALRWSRPQQIAEVLGDPRLPPGWWSSVALHRALGTTGLDWVCERLARLAAAHWDHIPLTDLLPALAVHQADLALPGWSDATRTAVAGLGGWHRLRRLAPGELTTPSATPEVVMGAVFRDVLGRMQAAQASPRTGAHLEMTRPLQRGAVPGQREAAPDQGPLGGAPQRQTGPYPAIGGSTSPHPPGSFPAGRPAGAPQPQSASYPAHPEGEPQRQTGGFPAQPGGLPQRQGGSRPDPLTAPSGSGASHTGSGAFPGAPHSGPMPNATAPSSNGTPPTTTTPTTTPPGGATTGNVPPAAAAPSPTDTDHAMVRVVDGLFRTLDKFELAVAVHRLFAEDPVSLRTLAHKMLVDREVLSQAQRTAEERVLQWLRSSESAPVTGHMFRLTEWLGAAATEEQLIGADPAHPVMVPSLRTPLWRVLVTLMPDRRLQDGWLVVGDLHRLQARTRQLLVSRRADTDVVELMAELGIRAHSAQAWLDALPPEASADAPAASAQSPAQPLPRRTPGANGHHHRGGQPIPAAEAGSIDPSAALATLSALSSGRSSVLPGLAGAPATPPPPPPSPSSDPRRWQRIEVTPEHLRGGPVPVPEGYAAQLGMRPGTLLSVTGPGDNAIVLVWQGHQPVFDSLQPVLMRLNARPGDQVYVTVDGYRLEAQLTA